MLTIHNTRTYILSLPESQEIEHWGKPSFRVRNKIFAIFQEDGITLTVKVSREDIDIYTQIDPQIYHVPTTFTNMNYMHINMQMVDPEEAKLLLLKAWKLVAPKKLIKEYEAES